MAPAAMVEHLVGLQAQAVPDPPYYGLWSRLDGFHPEALSGLIEERKVVRVALLRGTIHLVTAEDCLALRPVVQPMLDRWLRSGPYAKQLAGLDPAAIARLGRALVEAQPRTFHQLGALLAASFPDRDPAALAHAVRAELALVQVPPRGVWGRSGPAAHTTAEHWLGRELEPEPSLERMILRYLAAFGPATAADVQKWCGLTRLGAVLKGLEPQLALFRDEHGRTLYDLPEAPRPDEDVPAPVRLVAPFDNLLLSHADRTRVVSQEHRPLLMTVNGLVPGTLLVDGLVAGTWRLADGVLVLRPFAPLSRAAAAGAEAEGERLLDFAGGERMEIEPGQG